MRLKENIDLNKINTVIDYGGDEGQYIPRNITASRRIIFDPSNKIIPHEFEKINKFENLPLADLVMCCHTLEHVSYPQDLLKKLTHLLSDKSYIYIELPLEVQNIFPLSPNEIPRQIHEHINTFTTRSLTSMINAVGLKIITIYETHMLSEVPGNHRILSALCTNSL